MKRAERRLAGRWTALTAALAAAAEGGRAYARPAVAEDVIHPWTALRQLDHLLLLGLAGLVLLVVCGRLVALARRGLHGPRHVRGWVGRDLAAATPWLAAKRDPDKTHLLVVAHAFASTPRRMRHVVAVALEALDQQGFKADVLWLQPPASGWRSLISNASPHDAASQSAAIIASCTAQGYEQLVLVGHSAGALLLKKAWLFNHPRFGLDRPQSSADASQSRRTIDAAEFSWWERVERFVFLAGLGGGWDDKDRTGVRIAIGLVRLFGCCQWIFALRRGAPFIENMRVEWLAAFRGGAKTPAESLTRSAAAARLDRAVKAGEIGADAGGDVIRDRADRLPLIVQMVGTRDSWIDSGNDLDIAAAPERFVFLRVEESGHPDIIEVAPHDRRGRPDQAARFRREALFKAMTLTDSEARARESSLAAEAADTEQSRRARVKHVVVVLHGIRDEGAWAGRFRDIINGQMELADVHVSSERFPWIPMISFFFDIGGARERNVRWLADKYVRLTAQYPRLEKISFIGHSYGTYVFANCLQRYATIRFHNVFLAGCVLPRNFSWTELKDQGRFSRLCNAVASADTVVAVFPGFFEWLRRWFGGLNQSQFFSLGDAGFAGFEQQAANSEELTYLKGGHGAFLEAPKAPEYAATFVVQDDLADAAALSRARTALDRAGGRVSARDPQVVRLNHFAVLVFLLALILLAAIVVLASAALHGLALWGEGGVISEIWRPSLLAGLLVAAVLFVILNSF